MNVKKFDATHIKKLRQPMTKYRYTLSEDTTHIETQPTQIRFGFSLAEVLITLGIIGVVAAMTIPNLMAKYQKRSNALRRKNSVCCIGRGNGTSGRNRADRERGGIYPVEGDQAGKTRL